MKMIGRWQGAGLLATTLLGTSVFILPQITIASANQHALIVWFLLTIASIPIALIFAQLAVNFPKANGPAYFIENAFGTVAGKIIGINFMLAVLLAIPTAIMITFQFIESFIDIPNYLKIPMQVSILVVIFLLNIRGIHASAKLQLLLTLFIFFVIACLCFNSRLTMKNPLSVVTIDSFDLNLIIMTAGLAFWSFTGVETVTHLTNEFKQPEKDFVPAVMIAIVVVGLIYLACTTLLLMFPNTQALAIIGVFDNLMGGYGAEVIGFLGIAGGISAVNVYAISISRLACSFSEDNVLPHYFGKLNRHHVPANALIIFLIIMAFILVLAQLCDKSMQDLIAWINGVFVIIYFASMIAALKLLNKKYWFLIMIACLVCILLAWGLGLKMLYAISIMMLTIPLLYWQRHHQKIRLANL